MLIPKSDFSTYISSYTEDEIFYRDLYLARQKDTEIFNAYLQSLGRDYILRLRLYIPELCHEPWYPVMEESEFFDTLPGNIVLSKHYRYTPEFVHEHKFVEVLCGYSGTVHGCIQGIEHTLTAGDICIIPPNTKHSIAVFDDSVAINILIKASTFQSTFFQSLTADSILAQFFTHVLYKNTEGNYLIFHSGDDVQIRSDIEDLYIEYMRHEKYRSAFLNAQLLLLWARLLRYHDEDIDCILTKQTSSSTIPEILNYISQNYHTATLHETAAHFGYSTSHFSTLIKESTGRTFVQIIKDIKLGQACRALRETKLNLPSICELVGYESPEHFMRLFKKAYGMSPGEYRKRESYIISQ